MRRWVDIRSKDGSRPKPHWAKWDAEWTPEVIPYIKVGGWGGLSGSSAATKLTIPTRRLTPFTPMQNHPPFSLPTGGVRGPNQHCARGGAEAGPHGPVPQPAAFRHLPPALLSGLVDGLEPGAREGKERAGRNLMLDLRRAPSLDGSMVPLWLSFLRCEVRIRDNLLAMVHGLGWVGG